MSTFGKSSIGEKFFNELMFSTIELTNENGDDKRFSYVDLTSQLAKTFIEGRVDDDILKEMKRVLSSTIFTDLMLDTVQNSNYSTEQLTTIAGIVADNIMARAEIMSEMMLGNV